MAILLDLDAELLSHDSATLTLDRWCAEHRLASVPHVVAEQVRDIDKVAGPEQRQALQVEAGETVKYRRVRLTCGSKVLSEADNWYVPGRLSPAMNETLETTDTAFGRVVADLHFTRHVLASELLWRPLPDGWEMQKHAAYDPAPVPIPEIVLRNHALLTRSDGVPFSEVVESYTSHVLEFDASSTN